MPLLNNFDQMPDVCYKKNMFENLDIITIGEGLVELSSNTSLKFAQIFDKYYGGDSLGTAIAALRCGSSAGYITKLGNDNFCEYLLDAWDSEGLDVSQIKLTQGQNGLYFVGKKDSKSEFVFYRRKTAAMSLNIEDINFDYIKNVKCVYATGFVQSLSLSVREVVREIFKYANENGIWVAYDPNFSPKVSTPEEAKEYFEEVQNYIDIIFLNTKSDTPALFDTASADKVQKILADSAIKINVIREHKNGLHVTNTSKYTFIKYEDINIVDPTGWEAAFNGAFLNYFLKGYDTIKCAQLANSLSILQIRNVGAIKSIPNRIETEKLFNEIYG